MNISPHFLLIFLLIILPVFGEDWTTTDGKTYKGVTVVKVEADAVTIIDSDGGALVPLQSLSPDLQKRFNYDPAKAQVAAQARKADDIQSAHAMAAETAQKQVQENERTDEEVQEEHTEQLAKHPYYMQGYVLQKVKEGILVQCDMPQAPSDNEGLFGGYAAPGVIGCPKGAEQLYGTFLLKNVPNEESIVDKSAIRQVCFPSGNYTYQTIMGSNSTVQAYSATLPGGVVLNLEPNGSTPTAQPQNIVDPLAPPSTRKHHTMDGL